ncbi:MAG: TerB N-terminal domain-containing protein [Saccharofermentanales bacterium]
MSDEEYDPFIEIGVGTSFPDSVTLEGLIRDVLPEQVLPEKVMQPADGDDEARRTSFYIMRRIASSELVFVSDEPKAFYRQAVFMKDFTDEYEESIPFKHYYPSYQHMDHEQLRTYFSWRAKVRQGIVEQVSTSYAFLYIYELINNIGVSDPEDGFLKLLRFWQDFRKFDSVTDKYVLQWIKDYHVYYDLPFSFADYAEIYGIKKFYPAVFAFDSGREDSLEIFSAISGYNIFKSSFFKGDNVKIMNECFYAVLSRIRDVFAERGKRFEDMLFAAGESCRWVPFSQALFYPVIHQPDRVKAVSEREVYVCRNGRRNYTPVLLCSCSRSLIGYLIKETESALRDAFGYKTKLRPDMSTIDPRIVRKLGGMGIVLPEFVRDSVDDYLAKLRFRTVVVDPVNLNTIRNEALTVQEKLIVEDEGIPLADSTESAEDSYEISADIGGWYGFRKMLSPAESEALVIALDGGNFRGFALRNMIMPEMLADGINQKAFDMIGDAVLECEDDVKVLDDYRMKLTEILEK